MYDDNGLSCFWISGYIQWCHRDFIREGARPWTVIFVVLYSTCIIAVRQFRRIHSVVKSHGAHLFQYPVIVADATVCRPNVIYNTKRRAVSPRQLSFLFVLVFRRKNRFLYVI